MRCKWRGIARTAPQRQDAIRFWFRIQDSDPIPSPSHIKAAFMSYISEMSPRHQDYMAASFDHIAHGGLDQGLLRLTCYADYDVHEYLLGDGPTTFTVNYGHLDDVRSYEIYLRSHAAGEFGPVESMPRSTRGEYQEMLRTRATNADIQLIGFIGNRESALFLAPTGAHGSVVIKVRRPLHSCSIGIRNSGGHGGLGCTRHGLNWSIGYQPLVGEFCVLGHYCWD